MVDEMGYFYTIDLANVQLADEGVTWIQAMPVGEWNHPRYGKIQLTAERIARFAANVKAGVRGQELDIDYDHKEKTTEAAGWVKDAEARLGDVDPTKNGLWLAVEWTRDALDKIKNKAFRYFSPEYDDNWKHPATNEMHKDVLFGGALTNRPFLKGILPINLSEIPGGFMLEELRKKLGLPEDADEQTVMAAFDEKLNPQGPETPPENEPPKVEDKVETPPEVTPEPDREVVLASEHKAMSDRVVALEAALKLSEVNSKIAGLNAKADAKFAVTPVLADRIKELALEAPSGLGDKVFALAEDMVNGKGLVELGERGKTSSESGSTATKQFTDRIEALAKSEKIDNADAAEMVAAADPALFEAYRNESYIRERGGA